MNTRRTAVALVAIMLGAGLSAIIFATDDAATDRLDLVTAQAASRLNQIPPIPGGPEFPPEPQVFPRWFFDGFEPGHQIGVIDAWSPAGDFDAWDTDKRAGMEGSARGLALQDSERGYPIDPSNVINLMTVSQPIYLGHEVLWGEGLLSNIAEDRSRAAKRDALSTLYNAIGSDILMGQTIQLQLDHRYALVGHPDPLSIEADINDEGFVIAFFEDPRGLENPLAAEHEVLTLAGEGPFGRIVGTREEARRSTVDLTHLEGRTVWIAFNVQALPRFNPAGVFQDSRMFEDEIIPPFFGWHIDRVEITGPSELEDFVAHEVRWPRDALPGDEDVRMAPAGPNRPDYAATFLNRGRSTDAESFHGRLIDANGDTAICPANPPSKTLAPGGAVLVEFECPDIVHDARYTFRAFVSPSGAEQVQSNNAVEVELLGIRTLAPKIGTMSITPEKGTDKDVRAIRLQIWNQDPGVEILEPSITIHHRAPGAVTTTDVTANPAHVSYTSVMPPTFELIPQPVGTITPQELAWDAIFLQPGTYIVTLRGSIEGQQVFEVQKEAPSFVTPDDLYRTSFANGGTIDGAGVIRGPAGSHWRDWQALDMDLREVPDYDGHPQTRVWRSDSTTEPLSTNGHLTLRGEVPEIQNLASTHALRIEYTHAFERLNCGATRSCAASQIATVAISGNSPSKVTSLNVGAAQTLLQSIDRLKPTDTDTHPANRFSYYQGQWITEEHTVSIAELLGSSEVAIASLAGTSIEFSSHALRGCAPTAGAHGCPTWNVADATVYAITAGGEIPILRTTGADDVTELGTWRSYKPPGALASPADRCASTVGVAIVSCPYWTRELAADIHVPPQAWTHHKPFHGFGEPGTQDDAAWSTANADYHYEDGADGLLVSPAWQLPSTANKPTLILDQLYRFHHHEDQLFGFQDGGRLMLRFLREAGDDLEPATPFMPIRMPARTDPLVSATAAPSNLLAGLDCDFPLFAGGPGVDACRDGSGTEQNPLRRRPNLALSLDLTNLTIYDFFSIARTQDNLAGYQDIFTDPDVHALTSLDLTQPCTLPDSEDPCIFQLGLLADTTTPEAIGSENGPSKRQSARDATVGGLARPGEGWFVDQVTLAAGKEPAYDISVEDATLRAPYDWLALGLGPGTEVEVDVELENRGVFFAPEILVRVFLKNVQTDETLMVYEARPGQAESLAPGATTIHTASFVVPDEGTYRMMIQADFQEIDALGVSDEVPDNDCLGLAADGTRSTNGCSLNNQPTVTSRSVPSFEVTASVTPEAGRVGFGRERSVSLTNTGNVDVDNGQLRITVSPTGNGAPIESRTWDVTQAPSPGQTRAWEHLGLAEAPPGSSLGPRPRFEISQPGSFIMRVEFADPSIELFAATGVGMSSFDTFYADDFDGEQVIDPRVATGTVSGTPSWRGPPEVEFDLDPEGPGGWNFGDPIRGVYAPGDGGILNLPALDLSAARKALLSFQHKYDLEHGFDGGRLEYSVDEGATWNGLAPRRGYPGALVAGNALEPGAWDGTPVFTGTSLASDGSPWVTSEFDLANIPGFTRQVVVAAPQIPNSPAPATGYEAFWYEASWHGLGGSCSDLALDDCWLVLDGLHERPTANPAFVEPGAIERLTSLDLEGDGGSDPDPTMASLYATENVLWTGSLGSITSHTITVDGQPESVAYHESILELTNVSLDESSYDGKGARLVFWAWKDQGGIPLHQSAARADEELQADPWLDRLVLVADGTDARGLQPTPRTVRADGWTEYVVDLSGFIGTTPNLLLRHLERVIFNDVFPGMDFESDVSNRGLVIDDIYVEAYTGDGQQTSDVVSVQPYRLATTESGASWRAEPEGTWRIVHADALGHVGPAWSPTSTTTYHGTTADVWGIGSIVEGESYPINTEQALLSPLIDLRDAAGSEASMSVWHRFDISARDQTSIRIQPLVPAPGGAAPGAWQTIWTSDSRERQTSAHCTETGGWCPLNLDLSPWTGQHFRIGFFMDSTRLDAPRPTPSTGGHWFIDDVQVMAGNLVAGDVQLRLRATSDPTIQAAGWAIDNLLIMGLRYQDNVAVQTAEPLVDLDPVAPGQTMRIQGEVTNLGSDAQSSVRWQALMEPIPRSTGELPPAAPAPMDTAAGTPLAGSQGPFQLAPQGFGGASTPFDVTFTAPNAVPGDRYRISIAALANAGPLQDENSGDDAVSFIITVADRREIQLQGDVLTPAPRPGEAIPYHITLTNAGAYDAVVEPRVRIVNSEGDVLFAKAPPAVEVPARQSRTIETQLAAPDAGLHRVELDGTVAYSDASGEIVPSSSPRYIAVDMPSILFEDDFDDLSQWSIITPESRKGPCVNSGTRSTPVAPTSMWRWGSHTGHDTSGVAFVGATTQERASGATYQRLRDTILQGPHIEDLELYSGVSSDDPVAPVLRFWHNADAARGDGLIVQASPFSLDPLPGDGHGYTLDFAPDTQYIIEPGCRSPLSDPAVLPMVDDGLIRYAVGGSTEEQWSPVEVPLATQLLSELEDPSPEDLLGQSTAFGLRFASDDIDEASGIAIDDLAITTHAATLEPGSYQTSLASGADKRYLFVVENTGAARDQYAITLDRDDLQIAPFIAASVTPSRLTVAAGEQGVFEVRLSVPDHDGLPEALSGLGVGVRVRSLVDPTLHLRSEVDIEQFQRTRAADLTVRLDRGLGADATVAQGSTARFLIHVDNDGELPSRQVLLDAIACPGAPEQARDAIAFFETCQDHGQWIAQGVAVPALGTSRASGSNLASSWSTTLEWNIDEGSGPFTVFALVDADERLIQSNRANDLAFLAYEVIPLQQPDIAIRSLQVLNGQGEVIDQAVEGTQVEVRAAIVNLGGAPAQDVYVRLANRFTLADELLPALNPGETFEVRARWLTSAGNWLVTAQASTVTTELLDGEPNEAAQSFTVSGGDVTLTVNPNDLRIPPGESKQVDLVVANARNEALSGQLAVSSSRHVSVRIVETTDVPADSQVRIPVVVTLSANARADDEHWATFELIGQSQSVWRTTLTLNTPQSSSLSLRVDGDGSGPGPWTIFGDVTNRGAALMDRPWSVSGPSEWSATVTPQRLVMAPDETEDMRIHVQAPPGTAPGSYDFVVRVANQVLGSFQVRVPEAPAWTTEVLSPTDSGRLRVAVSNTGNSPGTPPFATLDAFAAITSMTPAPRQQAPGELVIYEVVRDVTKPVFLPGRSTALQHEAAPSDAPLTVVATARRDASGQWDLKADVAGLPPNVPAQLQVYLDGYLVHQDEHVPGDAFNTRIEAALSSQYEGEWVVFVIESAGRTVTSVAPVSEAVADEASPNMPLAFLIGALVLAVRARRRP